MSEQVKEKHPLFYKCLRGCVWFLAHTVFPIKRVNLEKLDGLEAPYILISNHKTGFDPIALAYVVRKYQVHFIGKKELSANWFTNWLLVKMLDSIPVDRHASDMAAMRSCVKVLKESKVLGIFPEGTRHKNGLMEEMEGGTALLALRANVPIVPVYLTPKLRFFRMCRAIIGEPMAVSDLAEKGVDKAVCEELEKRITAVYAQMERDYAKK